ncbi:MAG: YjbQ family protein [Spirochaetes bacterium]|nr:YjbQ family protein [Spirochaetota bacterium]
MVKEISVISNTREEMINIDPAVAEFIRGSEVREGVLTVFIPHTTAAVTINENADPRVVGDILTELRTMVPKRASHTHGEGNSDAHIKASLIGHSERLIVSGGRPLLGTWQSIYFCEFDGPRTRRIFLHIQ